MSHEIDQQARKLKTWPNTSILLSIIDTLMLIVIASIIAFDNGFQSMKREKVWQRRSGRKRAVAIYQCADCGINNRCSRPNDSSLSRMVVSFINQSLTHSNARCQKFPLHVAISGYC